eukprot:PhM_4_TR1391/c0_g1_i1/m.66930/K05754/ARPC5; actin related protein 2/3 complex, subunit 5
MSSSLVTALEGVQDIPFPDMKLRKVSAVTTELYKSTTEDAMRTAVKRLSDDNADTLQKVIYAALKEETKNTTALFKWQAAVCDVFGLGGVVRVLSDKPMAAVAMPNEE